MTTNVMSQEDIYEAIQLAMEFPLLTLDAIGARYGVTGEAVAWQLKRRRFIRPRPTAADRLWARVDRSAGPSACWPWRGSLVGGYGAMNAKGVGRRAHRVAYEHTFGAIPDGLLICHTCDNPACCNPLHLFAGTDADNSHDRDRKGRQVAPKGSANGQSRLTEEQVVAIRLAYAKGERNQYELADQYRVAQSTIGGIVRGVTWRHVSEQIDDLTAAKAYAELGYHGAQAAYR